MVNGLYSDREIYFQIRLKLARLTGSMILISWNYMITLVSLIY